MMNTYIVLPLKILRYVYGRPSAIIGLQMESSKKVTFQKPTTRCERGKITPTFRICFRMDIQRRYPDESVVQCAGEIWRFSCEIKYSKCL